MLCILFSFAALSCMLLSAAMSFASQSLRFFAVSFPRSRVASLIRFSLCSAASALRGMLSASTIPSQQLAFCTKIWCHLFSLVVFDSTQSVLSVPEGYSALAGADFPIQSPPPPFQLRPCVKGALASLAPAKGARRRYERETRIG